MANAGKNWDQYVTNAEEVARTPGFLALRDRIIDLAGVANDAVVADVGSGTGLLTLKIAPVAAKVWAIDISERMAGYLNAKASSARLANVETVVASAVSLPLVDSSVDVVVSNYCFHHLSNEDKVKALGEVRRVLKPGGRFVFGDMMFNVSLVDRRDRQLVVSKVRAIASRGVPGVIRVGKNALLLAGGRWEKPARGEWWNSAIRDAGFLDVHVEELEHEGGIAAATRPNDAGRAQLSLGAVHPPTTFRAAAVGQ